MLEKLYVFYEKHRGKVMAFLLLYSITVTFAFVGHVMAGTLVALMVGALKEAVDKTLGKGISVPCLITGYIGAAIAALYSLIVL